MIVTSLVVTAPEHTTLLYPLTFTPLNSSPDWDQIHQDLYLRSGHSIHPCLLIRRLLGFHLHWWKSSEANSWSISTAEENISLSMESWSFLFTRQRPLWWWL